MKHRLSAVLIGGIVAIIFGQIASAADLPVKAPVYKAPPPPPPTYSWTGFYFGGNVGGGWGRESVDYAALDVVSGVLLESGGIVSAPLPPASVRTSGVLGGLQLGYNWQIGPTWLVGLETDFDWSAIKGSADTGGSAGGFFIFDYNNRVDSKVKWLGTVRGRVGYLPVPNLLTYVTGGFAYGKVEHTGAYTMTTALFSFGGGFGYSCTANVPCFTGSSSNTAGGWTVGGGVEYALARNWTIRGEYLYVSLQGKSFTETAIDGIGFTPSSFSADFGRTKLNIARLAVNYRF